MNASELKLKINAATERATVLEAWIGTLEEARRHLLRAMAGGEHGSLTAKRRQAELDQIESGWGGGDWSVGGEIQAGFQRRLPGLIAARDELARLREAVELLTEELPSEAETDAARVEMEAVAEQAGELRTAASIEWRRLLDHLADAAEVAAELARLREAYGARVAEAHKIAEQWGLDPEELPARRASHTEVSPRPDPAEARLAEALRDAVAAVLAGDTPALSAIEDARRALRGLEAA